MLREVKNSDNIIPALPCLLLLPHAGCTSEIRYPPQQCTAYECPELGGGTVNTDRFP